MALVLDPYRSQIESLCEASGVERLELFGSATSDDFNRETSDADFLVDFKDFGWKGSFRRYMNLKHGLEDLLGRSVDLVERKAIRNPYFLKSATQNTILVYAA